jgi:hypothetical protein
MFRAHWPILRRFTQLLTPPLVQYSYCSGLVLWTSGTNTEPMVVSTAVWISWGLASGPKHIQIWWHTNKICWNSDISWLFTSYAIKMDGKKSLKYKICMSAVRNVRSLNMCSRHVPVTRVQGADGCVILFWISMGQFWSDPALRILPTQLSLTKLTLGLKTWLCASL